MLDKLQKVLKITVQCICTIITFFIVGVLGFTTISTEGVIYDYAHRVVLGDYVNNLLFLIIVGIIVLLWRKTGLGEKDCIGKQVNKVNLLIASFFLLFIQILLVYHVYFYVGHDAQNLRIGAENFVNGSFDSFYNLEYFQMCPNNLMAYMIYIVAYSIGKLIGIEGYFILIGCNIILANVAVLLSALTAYKLTGSQKIMWIVYGMGALLFGTSPWISVPYTDMMSIAAPVLSFYIYLQFREKAMCEIFKWFVILIVPFFMYGVKPLNIIVAIAIIICELLYFQASIVTFKRFGAFFIALVLVLSFVFCIQTGIKKYVCYEENPDKTYSLMWVLFLGSDDTTYGQWSLDNYNFCAQYEDREERDSQMLKKVIERISNMGITGYISHWKNKTHIFYGDGHFGWGTASGFVIDMPKRTDKVSKFVCNVVYPPENYSITNQYPGYGSFFQYYSIARQFIWFLILGVMMVGLCKPSKEKNILILKTSWIGVFLFAMLFETHARLLISFLPIFVIIAGVGMVKENVENIDKKSANG